MQPKTDLALDRMVPNLRGHSRDKRALLSSVVSSKLLYTTPVWLGFKAARNRVIVNQQHRLAAILIARNYRSFESSMVLAGTPPAVLLSIERSRVMSRL